MADDLRLGLADYDDFLRQSANVMAAETAILTLQFFACRTGEFLQIVRGEVYLITFDGCILPLSLMVRLIAGCCQLSNTDIRGRAP